MGNDSTTLIDPTKGVRLDEMKSKVSSIEQGVVVFVKNEDENEIWFTQETICQAFIRQADGIEFAASHQNPMEGSSATFCRNSRRFAFLSI